MIRRLTSGDAAAFRDIRLEALAECPSAFGADYADELAQPIEHFGDRLADGVVLGGFDGEALAAIIGIQLSSGRKLRHKGGIWGVYTRPAFRRAGLSGRLLDAAIGQARQMGLDRLKLAVSVENIAARRLYESRGFTIYGREPAGLRLEGVDYDEDLMTLKL